jgi:CBS domain containing-hemolysin-like protein
MKLTGHIPRAGDVVKFGPFLIEILEADPRRIKRLRFIRTRPPGKSP